MSNLLIFLLKLDAVILVWSFVGVFSSVFIEWTFNLRSENKALRTLYKLSTRAFTLSMITMLGAFATLVVLSVLH